MNRTFTILMAICLLLPVAAWSSEDQELRQTVQGFYGWVLRHGEAVSNVQPKIRQVSQSKRLYLDLSSLPAFKSEFMRSGYFAPTFSEAVNRYYEKQQTKLEALRQEDFNQLAKDGRGPMMETEDMDIFFCAQEYEYKKRFITQMKVKTSQKANRTAKAVVESPLGWDTTFQFSKVKGRWLIAGYCVYQ